MADQTYDELVADCKVQQEKRLKEKRLNDIGVLLFALELFDSNQDEIIEIMEEGTKSGPLDENIDKYYGEIIDLIFEIKQIRRKLKGYKVEVLSRG